MVSPINVTTDATVASVEIKTFYKRGLIKFAEKRTVFNQFGMKATIPKNEGGTYEWRRPSQLTKITGGKATYFGTPFTTDDKDGAVTAYSGAASTPPQNGIPAAQ